MVTKKDTRTIMGMPIDELMKPVDCLCARCDGPARMIPHEVKRRDGSTSVEAVTVCPVCSFKAKEAAK